jgi:2-dehydro-3-deoxygalactonokinase
MNAVELLGVDWGSTSVRAFCIAADGDVLAVRRAEDGALSGTGAFDMRARRLLGDWLERWPEAPIVLCGMAGSDRGWLHAPYVPAPCGIDALAANVAAAPFDRPAYIVPGVSFVDRDRCEVMRGEETLLMGLSDPEQAVTICLPGTHTKWVELVDGRIVSFRTYMTGELRASLLSAGALATPAAQVNAPTAFLSGFAASQQDAVLTRNLFQARARRLLGTLVPEHTASFVSGVLIGAEIAQEMDISARRGSRVILAAGGALAEAYEMALSQAGMAFETIDPEPLAARGLLRIARRAAPSRNGAM